VEHKATYLDALKGLQAARKYMCQFDTENNTTAMCNEVEKELYKLRTQEKQKKKILTEGLER
jgi:hypothetical protein